MNRTFTILLFLLIFISLGSISATDYYVDKDASGANNGTSWNNAWQSFSSINWSVLGGGDTMYISGGTTSKTYTEQLTIGASGTNGNQLVITKGISSGHNGEVIINSSYSTTYAIFIESKNYVTLQYITSRASSSTLLRIKTSVGIVLDSLRFPLVDRGHGAINHNDSGPTEIKRCY
ncbi:MAG: hypothetical protein IIA49_07870, partial [Bacteroidetes bacterium]|nr:hypothetical protein [Bacteroidota bacterium]